VRRLVIDPDLCVGNGRCYVLAPTLVTDDERGYGSVIGDGAVRDEQVADAERIVVACPERAITIVEG
jgi:ferredoxin